MQSAKSLFFTLVLSLLSLAPVGSAFAMTCDVDADGDIDRNDLNLIQSATLKRLTPTGPDDPRDADGNGLINSTDGRICALRCTRPSCATNFPPVANAGADQTAVVGQTVTLDGSASSDADGQPLRHAWSFVSRPSGSTASLSSASAVKPTFVVDKPGRYVIRLVVNDTVASSAPDEVVVSTVNSAPVANAGPDQTAFTGQTVVLDGSASGDVDGDALSYAWSFASRPAGSNAQLSAANGVNAQFVADVFGTYRVRLVVSDGAINSAADEVVISLSNTAPVANAGPDQNVTAGKTITLDGSASTDIDGQALGFSWSFTTRPAGSGASLSDPAAVNPSFTADRLGTYVAQLIVNDGTASSLADTVVISSGNIRPVANAGPDQGGLLPGDTVLLDGSGSSDVDGHTLTFAWSLLASPAGSGAVLSDPGAVRPSFVADRFGSYIIQLIVNDGFESSPPDQVVVTTDNRPPVSSAGPDQSVSLGQLVTLDGSASQDPDGALLSYAWSFTARPAGSAATLSDVSAVMPSFTADRSGTYVLQLIVGDGELLSAPDTVTISTLNVKPVANAGPDQTNVLVGDTVSLDGGASIDADFDPLTYIWSFTARPAGSVATLNDAGTVSPSFVVDGAGTYLVQLIVNDGKENSAPDSVVIEAQAVNTAPVARDDLYSTDEDVALNIPAPGVLGNDEDAQGDPLAAILVTPPASGDLTLNPDGSFTYSPAPNFHGSLNFIYRANDGSLDSNNASVSMDVVPVNDPPVAQVGPDQSVPQGSLVNLAGSGGDVDGDPLSYLWTLTRPAGSNAVLSSATAQNPTFTPDLAGVYVATLTVNDGSLNSAPASTTITVSAIAQNTAPVAAADRYQIGEGQTLQVPGPGVLGNDSDAQNDPLTAELVSTTAHGTLSLQANGGFSYTPSLGFAGIDQFTYRARDAALASAPATVEISVTPDPDVLPLDIGLAVSPQVVPVGGSVSISVTAFGGRAPVARALSVDGAPVALDAAGNATLSGVAAGVHRVIATVTDALGSVSRESYFSGQVTGDATAPTAAITAPTNSTELFGAVDVRGTANDANLAEYRLFFAPSGSPQFTEFARGVTPVVNGTLGRFDITSLGNGLYDILLQATDVNGARSQALVTVEVVGDQKVGNFQVTFEDLNVDAAGIPIVVTRTYSTARRNERLDFGYGWSVDYQNARVQTNMVLGQNWTMTSSGGFFPTYCFKPNGKHTVSITLPDGKVDRFDMSVSPECQQIVPPRIVTPVFTARAGTTSRLTNSATLWINGNQLLDDSSFEVYEPTTFTLTTEENYVYQLDKNFGIRSVKDPSGNTLTYGPNGIVHSGGQSVSFQRDGQGRITRITDPNGKALEYGYNANGDLATVIDRNGETARHRYNRSHGLVDFTDPRGVLLVRNVYDDNGKLIEQYDAAGNKLAITHDTANQREVVRDRRGFTTTYEYDGQGNVTRTTDALGGNTGYTYDARGNELTVTDPLGRVTTRTFSAQDRILSEADPLGNVTAYAYSASGQPTQITDPRGNKTDIAYSPSGNPTQIKDGSGAATNMAYDAKGNLTQLTDPLGNVTRYTYDAGGRVTQEQDALGGVTTFTYDANGKETSRTTSRTHNGAPVSLTTSRVLDANGQVLQETDANGGVETRTYNGLGKLASLTDKLGRTTNYEYDSRGHLTATTYPDGTRETVEYDANGNETARADRAGRRISYVYDALNRLIRTIQPDGGELGKTYDAAGQLIEETDARGNKVSYEYDAAGRRTRVTDALGNATSHAYDAAGNITGVTDARGNTTTHQYDAANRRTRTNLPDGTSITVAYDPAGRKTSETDQAGNTTAFAYDARNRLMAVTDPLGGITRYTYDEVGNKLSQEDALGRITRWEYDNLGRVTRRTLPEGQAETYSYDASGNTLTHTDFNGATTGFTYDVNNRLVLKRHADGSQVSYTYTPTGRPATVTDARGVTQHVYDSLDRLIRVGNPDGSVLGYAYDAAGNRIELTVQQGARAPRTTRFGYDALNRLASVTDPEGGVTVYTYDANGNRSSATLPNGTRTDYAYDALNRLTLLEHRRADNTLVARFAYTLAVNGQRVQAIETVNGITRTVDYTYDAYQRLVREQIADPVNGNRDAAYVYDPVGNRLTMTVNDARTDYVYDANDRLLSETTGGTVTTHAYDANGNTLSKRQGANVLASYSWDHENRLTGAAEGGHSIAYAYDADGNRVAKALNGVTSHYLVDRNRDYAEVVEERAANGDLIVGYVHGDDLIKQTRGAQDAYFHADGLGSVRALTNAAAAVTDTWQYEAFGNEVARTGGTVNEYRYTGEQIDANTGFYYLRARWMDPENGRFIRTDSWPGLIRHPITLHKYLYADADPANKIDPSGRMSMASVSIGISINVSLGSIARYGAAALMASLLYPVADAAINSLRPTIWHIIVYNKIAHQVPAAAIAAAQDAMRRASRSPGPQDHHTIPMYLCGHKDQAFSKVTFPEHRFIHTGLGFVLLFIEEAGDTAANMLRVPLGSRRSPTIRAVASSEIGRAGIASAIGAFYEFSGAGAFGIPPIDTVFPNERKRFVGGHHSCY